jgi:hypothetical protein
MAQFCTKQSRPPDEAASGCLTSCLAGKRSGNPMKYDSSMTVCQQENLMLRIFKVNFIWVISLRTSSSNFIIFFVTQIWLLIMSDSHVEWNEEHLLSSKAWTHVLNGDYVTGLSVWYNSMCIVKQTWHEARSVLSTWATATRISSLLNRILLFRVIQFIGVSEGNTAYIFRVLKCITITLIDQMS